MTRMQLECAVARATGESPRHVRRLGFGLLAPAAAPAAEGLRLVLDCPFHGGPVPYPGAAGDGTPALAECPRCDVYFEFDPAGVYAAAGPAGGAQPAGIGPNPSA